MKLLISVICIFISIVCFSQNHNVGIRFRELKLEQAIDKAKQENKKIFVDVFTKWCGPCKHLAKNIFSKEEAGSYFNRHFICIKVDAEESSYGEKLVSQFKIRSYPTLLVLDKNGKLLDKHSGAPSSVEGLISIVAGTIDENESIDNYIKQYKLGVKTQDIYRKIILKSIPISYKQKVNIQGTPINQDFVRETYLEYIKKFSIKSRNSSTDLGFVRMFYEITPLSDLEYILNHYSEFRYKCSARDMLGVIKPFFEKELLRHKNDRSMYNQIIEDWFEKYPVFFQDLVSVGITSPRERYMYYYDMYYFLNRDDYYNFKTSFDLYLNLIDKTSGAYHTIMQQALDKLNQRNDTLAISLGLSIAKDYYRNVPCPISKYNLGLFKIKFGEAKEGKELLTQLRKSLAENERGTVIVNMIDSCLLNNKHK